ncbi:hypothetical protein CC86DRAFT_394549 [Ophiobolus disseminans]|uniref:Uncharacterized protein n=1 Tax=Ophiobolus disseminans TaxID=1469910 RepID=A0A6A6ZX75_9PLEO|nr:hypothetical protein CC86DRAFT_394549 [Ophiobolus disseminans]
MPSLFLLLPREIRDTIYDFYVRSNGGYTYYFETNQLVQADGNKIELTLVFTCHQVADEMRGLALAANLITFSTFFLDATRKHAGHYHSGYTWKRTGQNLLLKALALKLLTISMIQLASERYPIKTRGQIRHVILKEDYESAAQPACHGRGFIPFCLENPKLRVERIVSLWQNAFPARRKRGYHYGSVESMDIPAPDYLKSNKLFSRAITKFVGELVVECLLLSSLGMPECSFTLMLDSNPIPEATTAPFNVLQLLPKPSWLERRLRKGYMYEQLPKAIEGISKASSPIRCNISPGSPPDPEALEQGWPMHETAEFETEKPLPP